MADTPVTTPASQSAAATVKETFLQKIDDFFVDLRKEFFTWEPTAAAVAEVALPQYAPLIGIADSLSQAAAAAAAAHDAAKSTPEYNAVQSGASSAQTILQAVVAKAPDLKLDDSTVTILNRVVAALAPVASLAGSGPLGTGPAA